MKTIILIICLLQGVACFSQHFPFVTDPGSLAGSGGAAILYSSIRRNDRRLVTEINNFNKKYAQRTAYLVGSGAVISAKLNNELNETRQRYNHLVSRNNSLVFFSYSKKRNNKKILATINQMITNIDKELKTQVSINVLYGEKLNLYQNTMDSFSDIHQLMDLVEDRVEQSALLDFLTRRR